MNWIIFGNERRWQRPKIYGVAKRVSPNNFMILCNRTFLLITCYLWGGFTICLKEFRWPRVCMPSCGLPGQSTCLKTLHWSLTDHLQCVRAWKSSQATPPTAFRKLPGRLQKNVATCKHGKGKQPLSKAPQTAIMQLTAALSNENKNAAHNNRLFRTSTIVVYVTITTVSEQQWHWCVAPVACLN